MENYINKELGFDIKYPSNYVLKEYITGIGLYKGKNERPSLKIDFF